MVAVDIETLLGRPAFGAAAGLELLRADSIPVRQDMPLNFNRSLPGGDSLDRRSQRGGVARHEGIPRPDAVAILGAVDEQTQSWRRTFEITVEDHREVLLNTICEIEEVAIGEAGCGAHQDQSTFAWQIRASLVA